MRVATFLTPTNNFQVSPRPLPVFGSKKQGMFSEGQPSPSLQTINDKRRAAEDHSGWWCSASAVVVS
jgi:hypothetical protein